MELLFTPRRHVVVMATAGTALLVGCGEWPRYQHKPAVDDDALMPGAPPSAGIEMEWLEVDGEAEPNDSPGEGVSLSVGDGILVSGTLEGLGWDPTIRVDRASDCDTTLAFPPASPGVYTGDVDWIAIDPTEEGLLCFDLESDHESARMDAALYLLGECGEPVGVFVYPNTSTPIGVDVAASHTQWAIGVDHTVAVAIGIAGFFPDNPDLVVNWSASLALVPSIAGTANSLCPERP